MGKNPFHAPEWHRKWVYPVTVIRGLGPRRAAALAGRGIHTVADLLFFFPSRYEDLRRVTPLNALREGEKALVVGEVVSAREERFPRSGKRLYRVVLRDGTGSLSLLWFHYRKPHLASLAKPGRPLQVFGKVGYNRGKAQMIHPDIRPILEGKGSECGFRPLYPAVEGVPQALLRQALQEALSRFSPIVTDPLPPQVLERVGLPGLKETVRCLHQPPDRADPDALNAGRSPWHRRLLFDRFFRLMVVLERRKRARREGQGPTLRIPPGPHLLIERFLGFSLTPDQVRVIREIARDLKGPGPMNRLVQGDVGCGKTVVAAAAAALAVRNGLQAAFMAPTQVLARQHFGFFKGFPAESGFRPALLHGGLDREEQARARAQIRSGRSNVIVGTHALFAEDLEYAGLGLVVIDEQHRFGVRQRALLDRKGENPHLLVMSATPIPRTLALTLYADLDISTIRMRPQGRGGVETRIVGPEGKREIDRIVRARLARGEQVMVICPAVEGSEHSGIKNVEEMAQALRRIYGRRWGVGLLHGRMTAAEKDGVMERFRQGALPLLVATTVVEVGVHAPRATLIIIEQPERFGLAQLHQLRGRVGRGGRKGLCLLVDSGGMPAEARKRLQILEQTGDGFEIARKDLELRGQGELAGLRQAGPGEVLAEEIFREPELLALARSEAERILRADPDLVLPEHRWLRPWVGMDREGDGES